MELIYPKRRYTINEALSHVKSLYNEKDIYGYIEAGEKELNHIILIASKKGR